MAEIASLYEDSHLSILLGEIDSAVLSAQINGEGEDGNANFSLSRLEVAAYAAATDFFSDISVSEIGRLHITETQKSSLSWALEHWRAFFEARSIRSGKAISNTDLLTYVACALLSNRQTEIRSLLKRKDYRNFVDNNFEADNGYDWRSICENHVTYAALLLVRQSDHFDLKTSAKVIKRLIDLQNEKREMIAREVADRSDNASMIIMGLYHLAHATTRTSEYLLNGRVTPTEGGATNFEMELRRLLIKAEEFVEASGSPDYLLYVRSIGAILWSIFEQSIWRQASGLTGTIDALLSELARRDHPIFSLLPSQQEALKSHLLDTAQIAVVLQMPTSAGKTLLAEFSMLQTFEAYKRDTTKVLYIAPTKALCTQTYRTLASDFSGLGIPVQQASSAFEEDPFETALISEFDAGVVVATPEKVDLFLRSHSDWFENVRLIVVDEAHLLSENERGVRLELLLANIKRERPNVRFLLLTPFVQNASAVAQWLGGARGAPINIHWRPARLIVGLATARKKKKKKVFQIEWKEPHHAERKPPALEFTVEDDGKSDSALNKLISLNERFQKLGLVLGMFPASRKLAEDAAVAIAATLPEQSLSELTSEHRLAIALAESEYGSETSLGYCLKRAVAFHHAALSPELRFLVEELGRSRKLKFLAATTTLAQGINFPVATVIVHSVSKPFGGGDLSASEFWNIAGRAGRVGLADKGLVIFANATHRTKWEYYTRELSEPILSALLEVLSAAMKEPSLKKAYRQFPQIRPFIQYLAHSAVNLSPKGALAALEEILEASFANAISVDRVERRAMRDLAVRYLVEISGKSVGYLKTADTTGFSSFSFDELYAKIPDDGVLTSGPQALISGGADALSHLVQALAYLPELELALGNGNGLMDINAVARVLEGWMQGKSVSELAVEFAGDGSDRVRKAGSYLFSTVSQTISWGAHAYIKGWSLRNTDRVGTTNATDFMLPAYLQHGVRTPEAAVASLFGIPRVMAESIAESYRKREGSLSPETVSKFRAFIESSDDSFWEEAVGRSRLASKIQGAHVRTVWRRMRGIGG